MKDSNFIKEMSWTTFVEKKKETNLVIIPSGAIEVYGPHLPLGSDTLVAVKIAERVADRVKALIGPTLEVGDSTSLGEFPGTIVIRAESFKLYLSDVVASLKKWGFKDFLFINSHLGNVPIINQICADMLQEEDIRCAQIDYWRFVKANSEDIVVSGDLAHAHASEAGTSVLLHLYPELVDQSAWVHEPPKFTTAYPDVIQYHKFSQFTNSGTIGDATLGSVEKGEKIVARTVERIVDFLHNEWGIPRRDEQ
jgi:creatinine amidohydrolase